MAESFEHGVNRRVILKVVWRDGLRGGGLSMNSVTLRFSKTRLRGVTFYIYITNLGRFS